MSKAKIIEKEYLIKEYSINKKTGKEIATKLNRSFAAVYRYLKKYNIKIRTTAESLKGKYIGKKACHYINGISINPRYCPDCGKEIKRWDAKKCKSCSHKKGRKKYYCIDCGTEIYPRFLRCKSCSRKGKLHWNWIEDRNLMEYGDEFDSSLKEQVRFRDHYKCQLCGCSQLENGRQLDVHHIDYNKRNTDFNNLISLCRNCHAKSNSNRNYWYNFYSEKIKF
jgi:hypothetical protein